MTEPSHNPPPVSPLPRRARQLRVAGVIALLLGIIGVGVVYWLAWRSEDSSDNTLLVGYYKSQQLQLEKMYGGQGDLVSGIYNALRQPGTQAILIAVAAALIAGGCFFFARVYSTTMGRKIHPKNRRLFTSPSPEYLPAPRDTPKTTRPQRAYAI